VLLHAFDQLVHQLLELLLEVLEDPLGFPQPLDALFSERHGVTPWVEGLCPSESAEVSSRLLYFATNPMRFLPQFLAWVRAHCDPR